MLLKEVQNALKKIDLLRIPCCSKANEYQMPSFEFLTKNVFGEYIIDECR